MNITERMAIAQAAWNNARNRAGKGWDLLSDDMKEALAAREALRFIIESGFRQDWHEAALLAHEVMTLDYEGLNRNAVLGKREQIY